MDAPEHNRTTVVEREVGEPPRRTWKSWLVGRPLASADAPHETVGKAVGLAVFASDNLSSSAYATQEILIILAAVGPSAFHLALPISVAICCLLAIVTISYEQTIHAYPGGGGSYIVARDNLGDGPATAAGAALLVDYTLTVAVSIAAGVAQIVSAYPQLYQHRVLIAVAAVAGMTLMNLRGVRESGFIAAVPAYFFITMMMITLAVGLGRYFGGTLARVPNPPEMIEPHAHLTAVSTFLILHAFASGNAAITGVEAISNGIMAFREPKSRNAGIALVWMASILCVAFLGISYLAVHIGAIPSERETVVSQIARSAFGGRYLPYYLMVWGMTAILIMAANTAFADFPRLSALMAADGFLPRQLSYKGSRLVFSRGILGLAVIAALLIIVFQASVTNLIPLYAIGVFMAFTLSQAGMARRWHKCGRLRAGEEVQEAGSMLRHDRRWRVKMAINGFGACCTFVVMLVFGVTKFHDGAWIVCFLIPALILTFFAIHRHYAYLAGRLSLDHFVPPPRVGRHRVIVPVSGVHRGSLTALHYARSISHDVTAVHVSLDPEAAEAVRQKWDVWGEGVRLVLLHSPYRALLQPLLDYIAELVETRQPDEMITVVVPQFVPGRWWNNLLHAQTALQLRLALLFQPGVVVTDVPYQLGHPGAAAAEPDEERETAP